MSGPYGGRDQPVLGRLRGVVTESYPIPEDNMTLVRPDTVGAVVLLAALAPPASNQDLLPVATPYIEVGAPHNRTDLGDLDEDGHLDLVLTYYYDGSVSVARGGPGGTFRAAALVASVGGIVRDSLVTDLDGDGRLDVAVLRNLGQDLPGEVAVMPGNGEGWLGPAAGHDVAWGPVAFQPGDLDRDGVVDLVVSCEDSDGVSVLRGEGQGRFARQVLHAAGLQPRGLALGDLDGDGALDAAVGSSADGLLHVLPGDGAAGFARPFAVGTTGLASVLALGDLDGDGDLDLVSGASQVSGAVIVHANTAGVLSQVTTIDPSYGALVVRLDDLDGDGALDLITRSAYDVRTFVGDGALGFTLAGDHAAPIYGEDIAVDDLDGDGAPDVLAAAHGNGVASTVALLTGTGSGPMQPTYWDVERDVVVADFDIDGDPDLAGLHASGEDLVVLPGLAAGGLGAPVVSPGGDVATYLRGADLDGDGRVDLVLAGGGKSWRRLANGDLTFDAPQGIGSSCAVSGPIPSLGDVDGDGDVDLAVVCFTGSTIQLNDGNGLFTEGATYPQAPPFSGAAKAFAELVDVDSDGVLDLIEVYSKHVATRRGAGDGTFGSPVTSQHPTSHSIADVGDVDLDGLPDISVRGQAAGSAALLLNTGEGGFGLHNEVSTGATSPNELLLHDLNGDGVLDLMAADSFTGTPGMAWWVPGRGQGYFGIPVSLATSRQPRRLLATDLNGDGAPELIVAGGSDTTVHRNLTGPWPR